MLLWAERLIRCNWLDGYSGKRLSFGSAASWTDVITWVSLTRNALFLVTLRPNLTIQIDDLWCPTEYLSNSIFQRKLLSIWNSTTVCCVSLMLSRLLSQPYTDESKITHIKCQNHCYSLDTCNDNQWLALIFCVTTWHWLGRRSYTI